MQTVNSVTIRAAYDDRERIAIDFYDDEGNHDGMTEQHHKDACDVHCIISQYDKTGLITHVSGAKAMYGDFTQNNEYQEALNLVIKAQNAFDDLPAKVRQRFGNDPGEFLEFVSNPENQEEMVKLGLAQKLVEPAPTKVEIVGGMPTSEEPPKSEE